MKIFNLKLHNRYIELLSFSANQDCLICGYNNKIIFVNIKTKEIIKEIDVITGKFAFNHKNMLAVSEKVYSVSIWDSLSWQKKMEIKGITYPEQFSPDNNFLASYNEDESGFLKIYNFKTAEFISIEVDSGNSLSYSFDGKNIAIAGTRGLFIIDVEEKKIIQTIKEYFYFSDAQYSPDDKYLAAVIQGDIDHTDSHKTGGIDIYKVNKGELEFINNKKDDWFGFNKLEFLSYIKNSFGVNKIAFSPDSKYLASGNYSDGAVKIWDMESQEVVKILGNHSSQVNAIAFSPDGKYVASGDENGTIMIFEVDLN